jgi:undecaprenyl-diphosphatase
MVSELAITSAIYNLFSGSSESILTLKLLTNILPGIIIAYFVFFCLWEKRFALLGISLVATAIGFALKELITLFFVRIRPYELLNANVEANLTQNSFYSTHTYVAFIFAFFVFFLTNKNWIRVTAIVLAVLTAFTRLALAQHYISDIIAGFLIALLVYLLTKKVYQKWFLNKNE